ncbi:helix-turn-helix domain-containing protein [Paenibacillus sp.]|uniref:helix-turn-helix domain-containing protein n=1 Tax=Paenibacillus sp. TaxID=58172 RepID=UPI002D5707DD|nr:helix-turn-helix domain-containing protein [Paenibacillus sp.]HZG83997.1 helix-turn-helix domain-containing protein [Paenibacillus sp.]
MHFLVTGQIERELLSQHEEQIHQHARNVDEQLSYLEISLSHWAFEPNFDERMRSVDYSYDFQATRDVNQYLLAKASSHPLIYSVELYINGTQPLLFNPSHTLLEIDEREQIEYFHTLIHNRGALFWESRSLDGHNPLKLIHTIPGDSSNPFGFLAITLDENKTKGILKTLTTQGGGTSLLVDRDRGIMASASDTEDAKELDQALWEKVSAEARDRGSFRYSWNNNNYSVSFGTFDRVNGEWMFISAAPMTAITSPVVFISKTILYVSLTGLLLAIGLSLLVSKRIYSPVGRLVGLLRGESDSQEGDEFQFLEDQWRTLRAESSTLRSKLREQLPLMKEGFLLQLLHGYLGAFSERELVDRMSLLGWNVEKQSFVVAHIQLTGFADSGGRFSSKDEELVTFAAANVIEELAQSRFTQAEVVNFHDLSIGLLLLVPEGAEYRHDLRRLCDDITEAVNRLLRVRLTLTIGRCASSLRNVPHLFQEVKEASIYRDFDDRNQVIDINELELTEADNEMSYSFALERELIQYLRMGQREGAERTLEEFLKELTSGGRRETVVQQALLQLLGRMMHTMLHSGVNPHTLFKGANMFDRLSQFREADEMLQWMKSEVIAPFVEEMSDRSNDHLKQVVDKVIAYVNDNYMRQDLSLESCAEVAGTNHYTLSRAFKMYAGKNFIDYLTEVRIEKAKDLIRDTGLKMYDIAERVGYQNSYFNRIFKKLEGVTPRQYRELCRKS